MSDAAKLIVVAAFDAGEDGELGPAIEPVQFDSEERATRYAESLSRKHAGVVAWARDADPDNGEYGEPKVLFQSGSVPQLE